MRGRTPGAAWLGLPWRRAALDAKGGLARCGRGEVQLTVVGWKGIDNTQNEGRKFPGGIGH